MKAKLKNGKIITGRFAEALVKKGKATEIKSGRPKKVTEEKVSEPEKNETGD